MITIEIHQEPIIKKYTAHDDTFYVQEEDRDSWNVYLVKNGEIKKLLERFDGFPIFGQRAIKSNQYEAALACAVEWCELLEIKTDSIVKVNFRDTPYCKNKREEYKKELQRKRKNLEEQIAALDGR